ncbi:hypothetical protein [Rhizobium grahamii]|uniref:SyrB-like regulator n=1 Tax=Rhizobium grahamii CCGE 502 TaxID=990285 RepID=S3H7Z2_9HYPH|nr:hypothetical protein [Rhizobium grahamii]EPE94729.1 hypothetical protein RGCCGE502_29513 [Rhizobium grahamii CCGE 502]
MADEIPSEDATTAAAVTPPIETKKKRAPRRTKAEMEAAAASKKTGRGARTENATGNGARRTASRKSPANSANAYVRNSLSPDADDGFDDLIELEAENQKLRKELAQKLRVENANLRSKLGLR